MLSRVFVCLRSDHPSVMTMEEAEAYFGPERLAKIVHNKDLFFYTTPMQDLTLDEALDLEFTLCTI